MKLITERFIYSCRNKLHKFRHANIVVYIISPPHMVNNELLFDMN